MYRVLLIGAGGIAYRHADVLAKIDGVKISGICDIVSEKGQKLAKHCKSHAYTDIDEAIKKARPDYAAVLTPRGVRKSLIEKCVNSKIPVFLEKPPCHKLSVGEGIRDMLESSGLLHSVGFMHRWNDALNVSLEKIKGQAITMIIVRFLSLFGTKPCYENCPDPYLIEKSGGLVGDQGIHYVDIIRYITRAEVAELNAFGVNQVLPQSKSVTTCDAASWMFKMSNGTLVSHVHSWAADRWEAFVEIVTTTSAVTVDMFNNKASGKIGGEEFDYTGKLDEFEAEHRGFMKALEKEDMSLVRSPYRDALESFRVAAEINRQIYGDTGELD